MEFPTLQSYYESEIADAVCMDVQVDFINYMNEIAETTEYEESNAYISASQIVLNY